MKSVPALGDSVLAALTMARLPCSVSTNKSLSHARVGSSVAVSSLLSISE
jgi:hypothetical protein